MNLLYHILTNGCPKIRKEQELRDVLSNVGERSVDHIFPARLFC